MVVYLLNLFKNRGDNSLVSDLQVHQPLELQLTLKPQQSMGGEGHSYVQLDMVVKCSPRYPDV